MRRCFVLLLAMCAVFGMVVVSPASPASAAPPPPDTGSLCLPTEGFPCDIRFSDEGTGGDLYVTLANKCVGPSVCSLEFTLLGSYDRVVIDRANDCTNGATCTITVDPYQAAFNSVQFRDKALRDAFFPVTIDDSCDATSVCVKSPPSQPPITALDTGGVCVTDQEAAGPCLVAGTSTGTGGNLHLVLGNKCSVPVTCAQEFWLTGSFNNVVIDRANDCSNHATCTITVHIDAEINSLQIKDGTFRTGGFTIRDRCDATAVCTKTP